MAQDIRFPSIDGLRAFEAGARLGSFERAGDELAIGASAVAKRVATVEELLGTTLFARGAKPLQLTPSGKEYLEQVRGALQLLAAMPLHRRSAQRRERLRVLAPPTFARQILVPRLDSFTATHAQIELELQLSVPYAEPGTVQADVQVRYGEIDARAPQVLLCEQVLPLAAPALLARLPPLHRPCDLAKAPLLRTPLQPWTPWFRAAGLDWPEPDDGPKLLDLGLTLEAAVSGQGVALARPALARPWLAAGSLVPVLAQRAWPAQHYQLIVHAGSDAARRFEHWLRAVCQHELADAQEELSRRL
jgi:LysR family transcriptional regulator, glycine cleavage system transcriptional activator